MCNEILKSSTLAKPSNRLTSPLLASLHTRAWILQIGATMNPVNKSTGKRFKSSILGEAICKFCGKKFAVEKYREARAKTCSFECKQRFCASLGAMANIEKYRGTGKSYVKFYGRHQHKVVAEKMILGRKLLRGEIVHHKNGNRKDNHPENLQVMTQSEHIKIHRQEMCLARLEKAGY